MYLSTTLPALRFSGHETGSAGIATVLNRLCPFDFSLYLYAIRPKSGFCRRK